MNTPETEIEEIVREFDAFLEKYTGKHENTFELAKTLFADTVRVRKDIIVNEFRTTIHHQLQKARGGLKARIELLLENNTIRANMDFSHGYRNALLDIESYLSELDQDKK